MYSSRSSKNLNVTFFIFPPPPLFPPPATFVTPSVHWLFISILIYVICLSDKNARSSLYSCKALTFSAKEARFVSLCTFKGRIVASMLVPGWRLWSSTSVELCLYLLLFFPSSLTLVTQEIQKHVIVKGYLICTKICEDRAWRAWQTETKMSCQSKNSVCFIGAL